MNRRSFFTAAAAGVIAPAIFPARASAYALDYGAIGKIRAEGMGEKSEIMATSSYLIDVLGPRLTGSPGARTSADWVIEKLKSYGVTNLALEPWPADPTGTNNGFPRGWVNTHFYMGATSPFNFPITGMSMSWAPGTNGAVSGECIHVPETAEKDLQKYAGQLKGKWVFNQPLPEAPLQWEPVARRYTTQDLADMETAPRGLEFGQPQPPRPQRPPFVPPRPGDFDRFTWFKEQGALGVVLTSRSQGVFGVQAAGQRNLAPEQMIPRVQIVAEHYGRIVRAVKMGQKVMVEADIRNDWPSAPPMFNIVGEIKGRKKGDEVVAIGGHFDSWHGATGATDNAGACCTAIEAMRILNATQTQLERTVRIALWTGEEQGLIGSRLYVAQHFGGVRGAPTAANPRGEVTPFTKDHARFQAYFNLDNGVGAIRGVYAQSNAAATPILRAWCEPFRDIGCTSINPRDTGSTDHISFDQAGLPGFQFIQDPLNYETETHHTNMDTFEMLQPEDMRRNATILAGFAMMAANHPDKLPRKPYTPPRDPGAPQQAPPAGGAPAAPANAAGPGDRR